MMFWLLLPFTFAVWCSLLFAGMANRAAEHARRGIPEERRGGVSVAPIIPLVPLGCWGIAWLIDLVASPWGTSVVGVAHGGLAVYATILIVRNWRTLSRIYGLKGQDR